MFVYWIKKVDHTNPKTEGYIGVSENPNKRLKQHAALNFKIGNAIRKYETEMEILFEGNEADCLAMETELRPTEYIGWNVAAGGGVPPRATQEHIAKLIAAGSKSRIGAVLSEETKRKISNSKKGQQSWLGKKHSEETKQRMRQYRLGKPNPSQIGNQHSKGMLWWNDGNKVVRAMEQPGPNFVRGRK